MEQQFQNQNNEQMQSEFNQQQQEQNQFDQQQGQNQQSKSKKTMLTIIGIAILVIGLIGVTYAFFNYTRTGSANVIKTGRMSFNSEQGTAINLTNLFPIDPTDSNEMNDNTKVGTVTLNVTGDTTYNNGIEYLITAVNVQNTVGSGANAKAVPISINVSVTSNTENDPATTLGTAQEDYFNDRGGNTSYYKVLATDILEEGSQLVVGYIAKGATGVDGNIVIKAYLDENKIAVSDTYEPRTVRTVKTTGYSSSNCVTVLTGVANASTYCATASSLQNAIDNENLTSAQIASLVSSGIVDEYTDGTTSSWVGDRTVFTTSEWNSLQANGVSFQVKVEANEGVWVTDPDYVEATPDVCFRFITNDYTEDHNGANVIYGFFGGLGPNDTSSEYDFELEDDRPIEFTYDSRCATTDIVIPGTISGETVQIIEGGSFNGQNTNVQLTSVTFPNTITDIQEMAFVGNNLTSVVIPSSVTSLGYYAFYNNANLATITFEGKTCSQILDMNSNWSTWTQYASGSKWSATAQIIDGSGNVCYNPNA